MQYVVLLPEYHLTEVFIEADSEEEAEAFVVDGDGDYGNSYYRLTMDIEQPLEVYATDSVEWYDGREKELRETSHGF